MRGDAGRWCAILVGRLVAEAHLFVFSHLVHHVGGGSARLLAGTLAQAAEIELAFGVLDQDLEQHGIRAVTLAGTRGQQAAAVADVLQPVECLKLRALAEVFQQQRQVVRQLPGIQLEAILAIGLDQVDHGLAAVA